MFWWRWWWWRWWWSDWWEQRYAMQPSFSPIAWVLQYVVALPYEYTLNFMQIRCVLSHISYNDRRQTKWNWEKTQTWIESISLVKKNARASHKHDKIACKRCLETGARWVIGADHIAVHLNSTCRYNTAKSLWLYLCCVFIRKIIRAVLSS